MGALQRLLDAEAEAAEAFAIDPTPANLDALAEACAWRVEREAFGEPCARHSLAPCPLRECAPYQKG